VGDFDGDGIADVARSVAGGIFTSASWQYSSRGTGNFVNLRTGDGTSLASVSTGHFDLDAKTDLLTWSSNRFAISSGAASAWATVSLQAMR
jgi:hypothetical protein